MADLLSGQLIWLDTITTAEALPGRLLIVLRAANESKKPSHIQVHFQR
jgi:hypothetical protein